MSALLWRLNALSHFAGAGRFSLHTAAFFVDQQEGLKQIV
jgi:hypothetical protein